MSEEAFYQLVDDRLEGWELCDMLGLTAMDLCLEFKDKITPTKMRQLKELLEIEEDEEMDFNDEIEFDDD
jgi:hypothetical protein